MDKHEKRLELLKKKFEKIGLSTYEIFPGVDGSLPDNLRKFNERHLLNGHSYIKTPGAMGILLTYINLIEDIEKNNYQNVLILEDDIYFHKNFHQIIETNKSDIRRYPVVFLGSNQPMCTQEQQLKIQNRENYLTSFTFWNITYGAFSVSMTRDFATQYLKPDLLSKNNIFPIDCLIWDVLRKYTQHGLVIYPPAIICEVRESSNNPPRDLELFAKQRFWDLTQYLDIELF